MKIRLGFVSNSSSASFVVSAAMDMQDFFQLLLDEAGYGLLMRSSFEETLVEDKERWSACIKDTEQYLAESKEEDAEFNDLRKIWIENYKKSISDIDSLLVRVRDPKIPHLDILKDQLAHYRLDVSFSEGGMTRIQGWTSMWNGMDDAGPVIPLILAVLKLKEIRHDFSVENDY